MTRRKSRNVMTRENRTPPESTIDLVTRGSGPADTASPLHEAARFVRTEESLWRQVADVTLVRTVNQPDVVELRGTGALLWVALVEPVTVAELAADLAEAIGAPLDIVSRDVQVALADLVHRGVVTQLGEIR
jgi:hypothetical protein